MFPTNFNLPLLLAIRSEQACNVGARHYKLKNLEMLRGVTIAYPDILTVSGEVHLDDKARNALTITSSL